jgi:hypothetical protein
MWGLYGFGKKRLVDQNIFTKKKFSCLGYIVTCCNK